MDTRKKNIKASIRNIRNEDIKASIRNIRKAYRIGLKLLRKTENESTKVLTSELAKEYRIQEEQVRKFRVLADKKRGFSREEMDEQFRRFKLEGKSLDLSHFIRSLALPRGRVRTSALRKALAENLSSHEFQNFISSLQPNWKGAGRKPKVMVSDKFDLILGRLVWSWDRVLTANLEVNSISNPELEDAVEKMQPLMKKIIQIARNIES